MEKDKNPITFEEAKEREIVEHCIMISVSGDKTCVLQNASYWDCERAIEALFSKLPYELKAITANVIISKL